VKEYKNLAACLPKLLFGRMLLMVKEVESMERPLTPDLDNLRSQMWESATSRYDADFKHIKGIDDVQTDGATKSVEVTKQSIFEAVRLRKRQVVEENNAALEERRRNAKLPLP
jgi:hypothetical protein